MLKNFVQTVKRYEEEDFYVKDVEAVNIAVDKVTLIGINFVAVLTIFYVDVGKDCYEGCEGLCLYRQILRLVLAGIHRRYMLQMGYLTHNAENNVLFRKAKNDIAYIKI